MQTIRLREITPQDCRLIWEWANEPVVRESSFSQGKITWEDHVQWFTSKLKAGNCWWFMAVTEQGEELGHVRFDINRGEAVISVTVNESFRNQGYGKIIINMASQEIFSKLGVAWIHAYVKNDNSASLNAFLGAGFEKTGQILVKEQVAYHLLLFNEEYEKNHHQSV